MRLALLAIWTLVAAAQNAPLTLPAYDMYKYAVKDRPFSYKFVPGGGMAPYSFAAEDSSALPPGLKIDAATGELAGTPTQAGEYRHTICIADATRAQICVPFLVITVEKEGDTYAEMLPARVNMEYQAMLPNVAVFSEMSYIPASGKIPDGMVLETTGRLYGTPRAPNGAWAFRAQGRDQDGNPITRPYVIRVLGPLAATRVMPNAFNGVAYSAQFTVLGDQPPHVWTVRRGPLPPGLVMTESGQISGVCSFPARYPFALRVTDASGASHDREMELTVEFTLPPLQISNASLPGATVGVAYRQQLNITGGREPYTVRTTGPLPPGITMSPAALFSGTPTTAGSYTFTVQVTDVPGTAIFKTFTIVVGNLKYTGPATVPMYVSEAAKVTLTAEGGTAPYRFAVVAGALPAGVTLSEAGEVAGTPVATGNTTATVRVADASGRTIEAPLAITVNPARPAISANGIVNGASYAGGGLTPGEIVTIYGVRMGPATLAPFLPDSSGRVPSALAGTRVLFGELPAPLLYVSATQIAAIVPYGAGGTSVDVVVDANGQRSAAVRTTIAAVAPGLFTADSTGKGQVAALNQDGSVNGKGAPAAAGSIVVLYGTGEGKTLPAGQDGVITGSDTPRPVLPVKVTIGGKEAQILYAGAAPGLVAGVFQVNVRIPAETGAGDGVPVVLQVGEAASPAGTTLAVR